jgi:hypothetical protein
MMENVPTSDSDAVSQALDMVDHADIYVGIFGYRYGYIPKGSDKSIAEMEYQRAKERGIPTLLFLMGDDHPVKASDVETGVGAEKLQSLKNVLKSERVVGFFNSPEELRGEIINALILLLPELEARLEEATKKTKKHREVMRVFVASPSDVKDERSRMPKVIESLNKTLGKVADVVVELWRWEADATPAAGEPQALIDPELDQADVVVVIFWNRFGMQTKAGTTGTEGEVYRSLERWNRLRRPQVMIYFCMRPSTLGREELDQRGQVLDFRDRVSSLALTVDYEEPSEFEWRVRDDLFVTLARMQSE